MIERSLNGSAESVNLWSANRIVCPPFSLKSRAHRNNALPKHTVSINASVSTVICHFQLLVSEQTKERFAKLLEFLRTQRFQVGDYSILHLRLVLIYQIP